MFDYSRGTVAATQLGINRIIKTPAPVAFITGGASGIGMGLARALHARGARVVVGGRNRARLEAVARDCPGMEVEEVDVAYAADVEDCAQRVASRHPDLNLVINNAGIQRLLDFSQPEPLPLEDLEAEIDVNLKGLVYATNAFLPVLKRQTSARLVQVSSALAFVPLVIAPLYSASKAAVHAFTIALRAQLRDGPVQVVEILPPAVETELHRGQTRETSPKMTLDDFTAAAMRGLDSGREEIVVGLARAARIGSRFAPGVLFRAVNKRR